MTPPSPLPAREAERDGAEALHRALRASEERCRNLIERNADGLIVVGADGTIAYANPAAGALLGRPAEALAGSPFGLPVVPGETTELDIVRAGGDLRVAEMRVVEIDWDGAPASLASLRDITERKQAERRLRESEERFRLLIDGVRDYGIFLLDPAGRISSWNSGAGRLLGYAEAEILGRNLDVIFPPEARADGLPRRILRAAASGREEVEGWRLRKDGSRFWAVCVTSAVRDEAGGLVGFAKVVHDLTERKRMEEELRRRAEDLQEADRQKTDFLAMLSHELRNPLAPVLNAVRIMQLCDDDPAARARARDLVEAQVRHMARLVDDLLDLSRITRGRVVLRKEPIDAAPIVRRAVEAIRPTAAAAGLRLAVDLTADPLPLVADPTRLEQILANLLNNAVKFTDAGGLIAVAAAREDGAVTFRVRDDGIGIDAETLPRIFELFSQAERSLDRSQGGLGIGLTLVRQLAEMHGGRVEARSDGLGRGSEFVVRLPAPAEVAADGRPTPPPESKPARPLRVLIVDDNTHNTETLALLLRLWGHEVRAAYDGHEGLAVAAEYRPEVVLLDIGLPRLDGYEVARRLGADPDRPGMRVIALTGYGQDDDRRRALAAGFDHHLVKPVDLGVLESLLHTAAARIGA